MAMGQMFIGRPFFRRCQIEIFGKNYEGSSSGRSWNVLVLGYIILHFVQGIVSVSVRRSGSAKKKLIEMNWQRFFLGTLKLTLKQRC